MFFNDLLNDQKWVRLLGRRPWLLDIRNLAGWVSIEYKIIFSKYTLKASSYTVYRSMKAII